MSEVVCAPICTILRLLIRRATQLSTPNQKVVAALAETMTLMEQVDEAIEEHRGWPVE